MNLYKYYNCTDFEKLYNKLKNNSSDVKQLNAFIEFSKLNFKRDKIESHLDAMKFFKNTLIPNVNECKMIFLNVVREPVYLTKLNMDDYSSIDNAILKSSYFNSKSVYIFSSPSLHNYDLINLENILEKNNIKIRDIIKQTGENQYYSYSKDYTFEFSEKLSLIIPKFEQEMPNNIQYLDSYNEFMHYYVSRELNGLDFYKDNDKIKKLLKIAYQDLPIEHLGIVAFDKKNKVLRIEELNTGNVKRVSLNYKNFRDLLNQDKNIKGVILFHNHPSGNRYSKKDLISQRNTGRFLSTLNIQHLDNLVLTKSGVYSIKTLSLKENILNIFNTNKNIIEKEDLSEIENIHNYISNTFMLPQENVRNLLDKNLDILDYFCR